MERRRNLLVPGVLAIFVVAGMVCAAGTLLLKYRLEHTRMFSMNTVREYIGVDFTFDDLQTEGVRTLAVTGLKLAFPLPGVGKGELEVDSLRLRLSIPNLFQGRMAIGDAEVTGGRLWLEVAAPEKRGLKAGGFPLPLAKLPRVALNGTKCRVDIHSDGLRQPVVVRDISFALLSSPGTASITGDIQAVLEVNAAATDIVVSGAYYSDGSFDLNSRVAGLTSGSMTPFVSLPDGVEGVLDGTVHAWGNRDRQVMADFLVKAEKAGYPGLPVPLENMNAALKGLLQWNIGEGVVFVRDCGIQTSLAGVSLSGALDLQTSPPEMDLNAMVTGVDVAGLLPVLMPEAVSEMGTLEVALPEPIEMRVAAAGPVNQPNLSARLLIPQADISFQPENKKWPGGKLTVTRGDFAWESSNTFPTGQATLSGGTITSSTYGITAEEVLGTVVLDNGGLSVRPITAVISGERFAGAASYALPEGPLTFELDGRLVHIEKTPLHNPAKFFWIEGDVGFSVSGQYAQGGAVKLKAAAEVTRGLVAYDWWLRKPVGVGATIQSLEVDITPGKKMEINGEAYIEDTHLLGTFKFRPYKGKWVNEHIRLDIPHLEVNSAGKCMNIPYTATGGACKEGFYEWTKAGDQQGDNISTLGGMFENISFLPDGGTTPLTCHDARVSVVLTTIKDAERSAALTVHAGEAHVPPFSETWLLPMGTGDPEFADEYTLRDMEKYPEEFKGESRPWVYSLAADTITVPPWEGRNFEAEVYSNEKETGFDFYRAEVGEGKIEGTYLHTKKDNTADLKGSWESIPVKYLIRHLELPEILEGATTGAMSYAVDQDDPRTTMRAEGQFEIMDGHFLADPLRETFKNALSDSFADLHPAALQYDKIASELRIEGDHITTDNLKIQSAGMTITGNGVWVMEGDMDYRIDIAVSPDMAEQIPVLRDNFNVEGFRMTQRNIELGFRITGPTFSPTGELAGLPPMGVTLVSGAAEMTGEAMKLLDTPRQMFLSIFRIGGSILGATKTQQQEQKRPRSQRMQP